MYKQKSIEELTFSDNAMFCWIMEHDKEICKGVIERLLKIKIRDITYPTVEKVIEPFYESKGVRLDVYVQDSERVFDLEIQTYDASNLPFRTRYYQSMIDTDFLVKGNDYSRLKESFIIFICLNDPIGKNFPLYTFNTVCKEDPRIELNDKTHKIFANAAAYEKEKDLELKAFLEYIRRRKATTDFTHNIDRQVAHTKFLNAFKKEIARMNLHDRDIIEQNAIETAKNFLSMGLSVQQVADGTGLSFETVQKLQTEH